MLFPDKPATGWGRRVRLILLLCATVMFAAALSTIEEGTGGFTSPSHRSRARTIILVAAGIAWWESNRA